MALELYSKIMGEGPALVILHGLFGSWENWGAQARRYAEQFTVYALDARNHGRSPQDEAITYPLMAQDVAYTLEKLGVYEASVIGHSMGGKTAMQLALSYPGLVHKLLVVDIAPRQYQPGHNEIFEGLCKLDAGSLLSRRDADEHMQAFVSDASVRAFLLKNLVRQDKGFTWRMNLPVLQREYTHLIADVSAEGVFEAPVLFIKGAESDYIEQQDRTRIGKLFPNASAKIMTGCGHWPHSEKPDVFYKLAMDFLMAH